MKNYLVGSEEFVLKNGGGGDDNDDDKNKNNNIYVVIKQTLGGQTVFWRLCCRMSDNDINRVCQNE